MIEGQVDSDTLEALKTCTACGDEKFESEFHRDGRLRSGRQSRCKSCKSKYMKRYWAETAGLRRRYHVAQYGITPQAYKQMLSEQNNVCAICGGTNPNPDRALCVDHDHDTGKVRSLLCVRCNAGIGCFLEDPARLERAITYIEKHRG